MVFCRCPSVSPLFRPSGAVMTTLNGAARTGLLRRYLVMTVAVVTALGVLVLGGFFGTKVAGAAATAPAAAQCDPPAFPTGAGFQVTCTITIANTVTAAGASSSTVTATACLAAAGVTPPSGCTTTVSPSNQLVTSVDQCNGIVVGGGSNLTCDVSVVNTIPTGAATSGVTVNQCIGSGTGGGTQPTLLCAPVAGTTNATVTQCNGSGNGGGASTRVQCNVTGSTTAEPVTVNQCNGSSNGGGSTRHVRDDLHQQLRCRGTYGHDHDHHGATSWSRGRGRNDTHHCSACSCFSNRWSWRRYRCPDRE